MLNIANQRLYDDFPCLLKSEIEKRMCAVKDGSDADTCFVVSLFAVEQNLHSLRDAIDDTIKLTHK